MYNHAIKKSEEDKKELLSVIKENTQINAEMKAAIQVNTIATTNAAKQTSRSMDRLNNTVYQPREIIVEDKGKLKKAIGYYIISQQVATTDGKVFQPLGPPVVIGAVDNKRKPLKPYLSKQ